MSKWTNATLTADGQNLQAQLLDGGGFEFTKVTAADSSGTDKLTLTMQPSVIAGKTITVPVLLSNSNLSAGFTMNQLKFYARKTGIPAGDEIVYAIAEDETGDEIPSESDSPGFTIDWSYTFQFGNATSVNVSIDPAGLVSMALLGSPGGIATLNNAGAVPIEQGGTGAVTASAALAALGGMRASATGDDIPTSASDPTSISSQLSNALKLLNFEAGEGNDLSSLPEEPFFCLTALTGITGLPDGWPQGRNDLIRFYTGNLVYALDLIAGYSNNRLAYRFVNKDWTEIATATPPQEFDLPLADNWTTQQASTYFKTQEGIVVARIAIKSTAEYTSGGLLFTLPEGFRPSENVEFPCTIKKADNLQASSIYFRTSGAASENHSGGAVLPVGTELYTLAIFIAAS